MDTTIDRKRRKKERELDSEKRSVGRRTENTLRNEDLPEFDWDAPENQDIIKEWDARGRKFDEKYELKGSTPTGKIVKLTQKLKEEDPSLSHKQAWDQAWETIMKRKVRNLKHD